MTKKIDVIIRKNTEKVSFEGFPPQGGKYIPPFIAIAKTAEGEAFERADGDPNCRIGVPCPRCRKAKSYYKVKLQYDFGPQFGFPAKPKVVIDFCGQIMTSQY